MNLLCARHCSGHMGHQDDYGFASGLEWFSDLGSLEKEYSTLGHNRTLED